MLAFFKLIQLTVTSIASIFAAFFLVGTVLAQEQVAIPNEKDFSVGQTWVWQRIDGLTGIKQDGTTRQVVLNKAGNKSFNNGKITYKVTSPFQKGSDEKPWISWPIFQGKTWQYESAWSFSGGSGKTNQEAKVVGIEKVTVPAGEFSAYKIVYSGFWNSTSGSGSGRQENIVWYSNEIKAVIKSAHDDGNNKFSDELIKYSKE
jgi:hypothetical protein